MQNKEWSYIILGYVLLAGLSLMLTGYFWQEKTTRLQALYYIFVVTPIFLSLIHQVRSYNFNRLFWFAFALVFYSSFSVLWSDEPSAAAIFHYGKRIILLVSLFFAISYVTKKFPSYEDRILNIMLVFASILAVYNIYQLLTTVGLGGRISGWGLLDNANVTAQVFGVMFLFAFMQFLKCNSKPKILLYLLVSAIILAEMILNKSRGQLLALMVGIVLILYFSSRSSLKRLIPIGLFGIAVLFWLFYFTDFWNVIFNRGFNFDCRKVMWGELLETAFQTPIFGRGSGASSGYEAYCLAISNEPFLGTHSVYMHVFLYTGIVGVILGLITTVYATMKAYKSDHKNDKFWGIVIVYGFIALIPNGDSLISRPGVIWILFWIPLAFIASRKIE